MTGQRRKNIRLSYSRASFRSSHTLHTRQQKTTIRYRARNLSLFNCLICWSISENRHQAVTTCNLYHEGTPLSASNHGICLLATGVFLRSRSMALIGVVSPWSLMVPRRRSLGEASSAVTSLSHTSCAFLLTPSFLW